MEILTLAKPHWEALTPETRQAFQYFILQLVPLENLFLVAAGKYARVRTFAVSATRGLAYFEDAEALPMPRMLGRTPWSKMRRFLEHQAMEAGRKHLEDLWEK